MARAVIAWFAGGAERTSPPQPRALSKGEQDYEEDYDHEED